MKNLIYSLSLFVLIVACQSRTETTSEKTYPESPSLDGQSAVADDVSQKDVVKVVCSGELTATFTTSFCETSSATADCPSNEGLSG